MEEITVGAIDEFFRHSITKLFLHFVASEVYRNRVIQMGEDPSLVFNVGALAIDDIWQTELLDFHQLLKGLEPTLVQRKYS